MKKLIVFPSEPMEDYIKKGQTYEYYEQYFNPGFYFDEVYCLSPWGDTQRISNINYIKAHPRKFSSIIKSIQPDIVRGYGGYRCADWAAISKVENIPTVVSVHDTNPELIHDSLKYTDAIICMSRAVETAIKKKLNIADDKFFILPNRIDTDIFTKKTNEQYFRKMNEKFGFGKHIIHVGRREKQKNLDTVIKALRYLPEEYSVIFIGQGEKNPYIDLANNLGVIKRCHFIDSIKHDDLAYVYSWCDCMCTPSRWEGFGLIFAEAASCECGIVTSNIAPMNEYLENKENAILIDEYENPLKIAEAIMYVCEPTEAVKRMKHNAKKVGLHFEKKTVDEQEISIYENIIKKGSDNKKCKNILTIVKALK